MSMGYGKYCVYEAFRRLEWQGKVELVGSGISPMQKVILKNNSDGNE